MVDAADDEAMQRIGPGDFVTVHQIDVRRHAGPKRRQLRRVVLRVAISVEDQLFRRRPKPGLQRGPVVAVLRMVDRADVVGIGAHELVGDLGSRVGAAVIDDEYFEVRRQLRRGFDGADHHARDGAAVVVRRKEDTQTRGFAGGIGWHLKKPPNHSTKRVNARGGASR